MACNVPVSTLIGLIGHDGSALPYSDSAYHAGFHSQECIEAAMKLGWLVTPIELFPAITPNGKEERIIYFGGNDAGNWARFLQHLKDTSNGVLEGVSRRKGFIIGHAVAWDGLHIYDPRGHIYSFAEHEGMDFFPRILWKLTRNGGKAQ